MKYKTMVMFSLFGFFLLNSGYGHCSNKGYIYGKVAMNRGEIYEGIIRWSTHEIFWDHLFNAEKLKNPYEEYFPQNIKETKKEQIRLLFGIVNITSKNSDVSAHQFITRFGNIKQIEINGSKSVLMTMKNGEQYNLSGNTTDIGGDIKVYDNDLGMLKVRWNDIKKVTFLPTPENVKIPGKRLYANVKSESGEFSGPLQWDYDECISSDELNGKVHEVEIAIAFEMIQSITKNSKNSSLVKLKSSREFELTGSNDVNSENRGIVIHDSNYGDIEIPWNKFIELTITDQKDNSGEGYSEFNDQNSLNGTVFNKNGKKYEGQIVFDLDETFNYEFLDGLANEVKYLIDFRNISSIKPLNLNSSQINLKNGKSLILDGSNDVNSKNSGVLIIEKDGSIYLSFEDIREINFK